MNDRINFSKNWNNKLTSEYFTTIRLYNDVKYKVGNTLDVYLGKNKLKSVRVVAMKPVKLESINTFMAAIDTGMSVGQCKGLFRKMYPNADFNTQNLSFVLLQTVA